MFGEPCLPQSWQVHGASRLGIVRGSMACEPNEPVWVDQSFYQRRGCGNSLIFRVKKKFGEWRLMQDLREVNETAALEN